MISDKFKQLVVPVLFCAFTSQYAEAAFVMTLDDINDNAAPVIVYDGTGSDLNGVDGVITFSGAVGVFNVNVTTGVSKPVVGPARLDLNSIDVSGSAGTLVLGISDTDFTLPATAFNAAFGGTTDGTVEFSFLYDENNTEFGGPSFVSEGYSATQANSAFSSNQTGSVTADTLYSLSIMAEISHGDGFKATSFNAGITPVPAPAALLLFGTAIGGLLLRKSKKS